MRLFKSSIVAFLVFLSSSAGAAISGTYVGSGSDIAVLLQLVETGGGQLSGRYEQQKVVTELPPCFVELCEAVVAVNDVKRPSQFGQERDCLFPFRSERRARAAMPEVACRL